MHLFSFTFFRWHARVYITVSVSSKELCGGVNGVGPLPVSVVENKLHSRTQTVEWGGMRS